MADCIILTSAGRMDVQLVRGGTRVPIAARGCRRLHDELMTRLDAGDVTIVASPARDEGSRPIDTWPSEPFSICTPKLDSLIEATAHMVADGSGQIVGVVILQTNRSGGRFREDEPHAVGRVLTTRSVSRLWPGKALALAPLNIDGPVIRPLVGWVDVLSGKDTLDGPRDQDYPVSRLIADRIDRVVARLASRYPHATLAVSTKGGPPPLKNVIEASAELRFGGDRWKLFEASEDDSSDVVTQATPALWPAAEVLRTRRHAESLIRQGDFRGALSSAKHLTEESNPARADDENWLRELDQVAQWMDGFDVAIPTWFKTIVDRLQSSGAPKAARSPLPRGDVAVSSVPPHAHAALRAAWKAESARRSGRIPDALSHTGTFLDAVLLDLLRAWADSIDPEEQTLTPPARQGRLVGRLRETQVSGNPPREWACLKRNNKYASQGHAVKRWFELLGKRVCMDFNERYVHGKPPTPLTLRNHVVHGFVSSAFLQKAQQKMIDKSLWVDRGFMASQVVSKVLEEIGISGAAQGYDSVINELNNALLAARLT